MQEPKRRRGEQVINRGTRLQRGLVGRHPWAAADSESLGIHTNARGYRELCGICMIKREIRATCDMTRLIGP